MSVELILLYMRILVGARGITPHNKIRISESPFRAAIFDDRVMLFGALNFD